MLAELREPVVVRAVRLALGEHDGIVLIHREQALAAAGGAEHGQRIGTRRLALPFFFHAPLGQHAGAPRQPRRARATSPRRCRARTPSATRPAAARGNRAQAVRQRRNVVGLLDPVAEDRGFLRAQPQQVARGDDAGNPPLRLRRRDGAA